MTYIQTCLDVEQMYSGLNTAGPQLCVWGISSWLVSSLQEEIQHCTVLHGKKRYVVMKILCKLPAVPFVWQLNMLLCKMVFALEHCSIQFFFQADVILSLP